MSMNYSMQPEFSTEQQLYLITTDIEEIRETLNLVDSKVKEIHVWLVGDSKQGALEELRGLTKAIEDIKIQTNRNSSELILLKEELRIFVAKVSIIASASLIGINLLLKFWHI